MDKTQSKLPTILKDFCDKATEKTEVLQSSYSAHGSVVSFIFYLQFQVETEGKTFNGKGGGLSSPGGGALYGTIFTDDKDKLFAETTTFQFNCASVYTSILFFDSYSNLLGHFESGSVSTVIGIGGGSGSWS